MESDNIIVTALASPVVLTPTNVKSKKRRLVEQTADELAERYRRLVKRKNDRQRLQYESKRVDTGQRQRKLQRLQYKNTKKQKLLELAMHRMVLQDDQQRFYNLYDTAGVSIRGQRMSY